MRDLLAYLVKSVFSCEHTIQIAKLIRRTRVYILELLAEMLGTSTIFNQDSQIFMWNTKLMGHADSSSCSLQLVQRV